MAARSFIVDARHYLDVPPEANLPFIDFLRSVSRAGSVRVGDKAGISPIRCTQRPNQRLCLGRTVVGKFDETIQWACTSCGTEGIINGWRGTPWDLSLSESGDTSNPVILSVSQAEYAALTHVPISSREVEVILASAVWRDGRAVMTGDYDDFDQLSEGITNKVKLTKDRRLREDLYGVAELLDSLLRQEG